MGIAPVAFRDLAKYSLIGPETVLPDTRDTSQIYTVMQVQTIGHLIDLQKLRESGCASVVH